MEFPRIKIGKQGTWIKALILLVLPIALVFSVRWIIVEPFVIPSESMLPNLLVHDHIVVAKYSYGIKNPLGDGWVIKYKEPQRGDVVVFRYPKNRDIFFIKRLIGLPGDKISVQNGQIILNGQAWILQNVAKKVYGDDDNFNYFIESVPNANLQDTEHLIRLALSGHVDPVEKILTVPENSYFVMGDNRDQSHDSRFWGFVDEKYLIGRATYIWLSCEDTIPTAPMICDPMKLRPERIFKKIGFL